MDRAEILSLLADLKTLEAAASPRPWEQHDGGHDFPSVCQATSKKPNGSGTCGPIFDSCGRNPKADTEFAAEIRNAAPLLIALAEAGLGLRETVGAIADDWGRTEDACAAYDDVLLELIADVRLPEEPEDS